MPTAPPGRLKEDSDELSKTHCTKLIGTQGMEESPQKNAERTTTIPLLVPSQLIGQSKGKQPSSSDFLVDENDDPSHPSSICKRYKKEVGKHPRTVDNKIKSREITIRIGNAFRAMKVIGIKEDKVRPVLKAVLISTGKNWELIEKENYRALANAVLKGDQREVEEHPRENADNEIHDLLKEETHEVERLRKRYLGSQCAYLDTSNTNLATEHEEPMKRLKMRYLGGHCSSLNMSKTSMPTAPPGGRKENSDELSKTHCTKLTGTQGIEESPQENTEGIMTIPLLVPSQLHGQSKGKQPRSSDFLVDENVDPSHSSSMSEKDKQEIKSCIREIRIRNAFRAMKVIGIKEAKVRPVLKALLISTGKNWELIEEENYRALVDAVVKEDQREVEEHPRENVDNETQDLLKEDAHEAEEPLGRLKQVFLDGQSSSLNTSNTSMPTAPSGRPKEVPDELSITHSTKSNGTRGMEESPQKNIELTITMPLLVTSKSLGQNKGKQPSSSNSSVPENDVPCHPSSISRSQQTVRLTNAPRIPMRLAHRGTEATAIQTLSKNKRSVSKSSPHAIQLKEPDVEPDTLSSPKNKKTGSANKPKDEPITGDMPCSEFLVNMFHTGKSHGGNSQNRNSTVRADCTLEPTSLQSSTERNTVDSAVALDESRNNESRRGECSSTLEIASSPSGDVKLSLSYKLSHGRPKSTATDVRGAKGSVISLNTFVDSRSGTKVVQRKNGMNGGTQLNKLDAANEIVINRENQGTIQDVDIARGQEKNAITLVNEVNDELPPSFCYIRQNIIFQNAYANFSLSRMGDNNCCSTCSGDCLSLPVPCACSHETGGEFAYTADGIVKEEFLNDCISMNRNPEKHCQYFCKECPLERSKCEDIFEPCKGHLVRKFVKECWIKCGCTIQCGNRVVQRGISRKIQVFMTPKGKGWGLRTLEDLPKGAFVCEYIGEILTNTELFERVSRIPEGEKLSHSVLLDADWCAEGVLKDEEALCLDATYYGNIVRFINHRCYDSNLVEIPVEVETPDHHYYHLAFFTSRKVKAMEELTWDYGINFDDHEHPIKAFHCQCGSKFCRNTKRSKSKERRR